MTKKVRLNEQKLAQFIAQQTDSNQAFALLDNLCRWLRSGGAKHAPRRFDALYRTLASQPELCRRTVAMLFRWLLSVRLYPLFISCGIFSRGGFGSEMRGRLYERFNPSYKDYSDLRDVFFQLFCDHRDIEWLNAVPEKQWLKMLCLCCRHTSPHDRETAHNYLRTEGLYAVEMLSIWVAAEELNPDLIRLDGSLLEVGSPFVALKREVSQWVDARRHNQHFDDSHLYVMLEQCRSQVERLRKRGTGAGTGSSLDVAHLLERLEQTLNRLVMLMDVFLPEKLPPRRILQLAGTLAASSAEQHSISWLWKRSVKMLSRSITQNTSDHGEHYITRNRKEYFGMFYSAAGGGVLIALMSLHKIYLAGMIDNRFWLGLAEGLNYGLGFALIFVLHFTVATKQPAMTASRFAAVVERNDKGKAVEMKLAQLLVDVLRSQSVAVFGNVAVAVAVASLIAWLFEWRTGMALLDSTGVAYQLQAIDPLKPTLWYAAIAGVWLFCSGIISGFFDNRCDYLNMRMRLRHHPLLKILMPARLRAWFADYVHNNYGSLMGNICFGMLLGMTGVVGHLTGLPLDIRHVAFSSANVGYTAVSGGLPWYTVLQCLLFVLMIGSVNLLVSFGITLWVALRSRETAIDSWWAIFKCFCRIVRQRPLSLIWPTDEAAEHKSPDSKTAPPKSDCK